MEHRHSKMHRVRQLVKSWGSITVQDIVDEIGVSPDHARAITSRLMREGYIFRSGTDTTRRVGRSHGFAIYKYNGSVPPQLNSLFTFSKPLEQRPWR